MPLKGTRQTIALSITVPRQMDVLHAWESALVFRRGAGLGSQSDRNPFRRQTEHLLLAAFLQAPGSRRGLPRPRVGARTGQNQRSTSTLARGCNAATAATRSALSRRLLPAKSSHRRWPNPDRSPRGGLAGAHRRPSPCRRPGVPVLARLQQAQRPKQRPPARIRRRRCWRRAPRSSPLHSPMHRPSLHFASAIRPLYARLRPVLLIAINQSALRVAVAAAPAGSVAEELLKDLSRADRRAAGERVECECA